MSRRREYPVHPFVGASALIPKDDKYLLIKRAGKPDQGLWTVPGGLIEVGEKAADAAKREVLEETGLIVDVGDRLGVIDKIELDDEGKTRYHFVVLVYNATLIGGELKACDDALEANWVRLEDFKDYDVSPSLTKILIEAGVLSD